MDTRPIARAGRTVAAIGVGTRGLAARRSDPEQVSRAIHVAIESGCTLVDVAPGWGDAQRLTGEAVRALRARDAVVVASLVAPEAGTTIERALSPAYVQRTVERGLRALQAEAIPLVWLGGWRDAWLGDRGWPELRGALDRLVYEGKVLAWGVAAQDGGAADAVAVIAEPWCAAVQVRRSLFDRDADAALVPAAIAAGVAVIAREPLAGGALGGELGPGARFLPRDERAAWPAARLAALVPELARLAALVTTTPPAATATDAGRALLDGVRRPPDLEQATVAELALLDAIAPPITAAVVGVGTALHAVTAMACADGRRLPPRIAEVLAARTWGDGWYREA